MKSIFGWLVLAAALAIPAVLFWKWWAAMQTTTSFEVKQKPPSVSSGFGAVRSAQENPISTAAPAAPVISVAAPPLTPSDALDAPPDIAPNAASSPQTAHPQAIVSSQPSGKPSGMRYQPDTQRDPMLSIFDLRDLAKERLARELARRQLEEAARPKPRPKPEPRAREKPLCETAELQGIISSPNGVTAIINDEVKREGDMIGDAMISRITDKTVIFTKGNKTLCTKRLQK